MKLKKTIFISSILLASSLNFNYAFASQNTSQSSGSLQQNTNASAAVKTDNSNKTTINQQNTMQKQDSGLEYDPLVPDIDHYVDTTFNKDIYIKPFHDQAGNDAAHQAINDQLNFHQDWTTAFANRTTSSAVSSYGHYIDYSFLTNLLDKTSGSYSETAIHGYMVVNPDKLQPGEPTGDQYNRFYKDWTFTVHITPDGKPGNNNPTAPSEPGNNNETGVYTVTDSMSRLYIINGSNVSVKPNRVLPNGSQWKYDKKVTINGVTYYRVSSEEWVSEQQGTINNSSAIQHIKGVVTVNGDKYAINLFHMSGDQTHMDMERNRVLPSKTKWVTDEKITISGITYYRVSTNEWVISTGVQFK